jgi:hypothetical protein
VIPDGRLSYPDVEELLTERGIEVGDPSAGYEGDTPAALPFVAAFTELLNAI